MSGENTTPSNPNNSGLDAKDFDYFSPRDVDNDGNNDVIHTRTFDGQVQVHHLDDNGEVILTEIDIDSDGILETTVRSLDDTTAVMHQDTDGDGQADTAKVFDTQTNTTLHQDLIEDGVVVHSIVDADGDGIPDVELFDTDRDGTFDAVAVDSDKDGIPNSVFADTDGDGKLDLAKSDVDNTDGILETTVTAEDLGSDSFGSISDFADMVEYPAEGSSEAPAEEPGDDYGSEA